MIVRLRSEEGLAIAGVFLVSFIIAMLSGDFLGHTGMYILIGALPLMEQMAADEREAAAAA